MAHGVYVHLDEGGNAPSYGKMTSFYNGHLGARQLH